MDGYTILGIVAATESWIIIMLLGKQGEAKGDKEIIKKLSNENKELKEKIEFLRDKNYDYHMRNLELEKQIEKLNKGKDGEDNSPYGDLIAF